MGRDHPDSPRGPFGGPSFGGPRGRHGGRLFNYGELRLLLLALIAERPCHGYELIKIIEERLGGSYTPSPGVIYPTLAWLEDMGFAAVDPGEAGRKSYRITPEGEAFLAQSREAADALLARTGGGEGREGVPAPVLRAMQNLRMAMRLRLRGRAIDAGTADEIAAALDAAVRIIERA